MGGAIGFFAMFVALIMGTKIFFDKIINPDSILIQGWTSQFLATLFFGGLLSILIGIVLEYLSVILLHIQGKPTFFVVDRQSDRILLDYYNDRENE